MKSFKWIAFLLFSSLSFCLKAQEIRYDRVDFMESPAWSDVLATARQTGKLIFLDGYTSWCRPCKKMDKEVFTKREVANYFNQKFINVKYDMEKGEGPRLKTMYNVSAFPTYLFISGNGEVLHRIVGAHTEGSDFLDHSILADKPGKSYADLQTRYKNGERNSELIFSYLKALRMAGEMDKESGIVNDYLRLMTADHFMDASYWDIVKVFLKDPVSREFRILIDHRTEIREAIGQQEVDNKIYAVLDEFIVHAMDFNTWKLTPKENIGNVVQMIKDTNLPQRNELLSRALVAQHYRLGEYYDLSAVVDAMINFDLLKNYPNTPSLILEYASTIDKMAVDEKLLKKAMKWMEFISPESLTSADKSKYDKIKSALEGKI